MEESSNKRKQKKKIKKEVGRREKTAITKEKGPLETDGGYGAKTPIGDQ